MVAHDETRNSAGSVLAYLRTRGGAAPRRNAQRLASEVFAWDKTTGPLARFVRRPTIRHERIANAQLGRVITAVTGRGQAQARTRQRA